MLFRSSAERFFREAPAPGTVRSAGRSASVHRTGRISAPGNRPALLGAWTYASAAEKSTPSTAGGRCTARTVRKSSSGKRSAPEKRSIGRSERNNMPITKEPPPMTARSAWSVAKRFRPAAPALPARRSAPGPTKVPSSLPRTSSAARGSRPTAALNRAASLLAKKRLHRFLLLPRLSPSKS